jgi:hypothetical protein
MSAGLLAGQTLLRQFRNLRFWHLTVVGLN